MVMFAQLNITSPAVKLATRHFQLAGLALLFAFTLSMCIMAHFSRYWFHYRKYLSDETMHRRNITYIGRLLTKLGQWREEISFSSSVTDPLLECPVSKVRLTFKEVSLMSEWFMGFIERKHEKMVTLWLTKCNQLGGQLSIYEQG